MSTTNERAIQDDFAELSSAVGDAFYPVWDFVTALEDGEFKWERMQWVYRPNNFITISVHSARAHNVQVDLRGYSDEFPRFEHLPLVDAQHGYSRFRMDHISQLDAALFYIRRAHVLSKRGRGRVRRSMKIVEE